MRRGLLLCAVLLLAPLQACEPPPRRTGQADLHLSDNLTVVITDVQSAHTRALQGDTSGIRALPHNIEVLTRAIESGTADADGTVTLRYYRATARHSLSYFSSRAGLPVDRELAQGAVADFLAVAESAGDDPAKRKLKADALYGAAQVLIGPLGDDVRGYRYFRECSDLQQAGCQNVMAEAMLTGDGGVAQDLDGSLALHKAVYDTGMTYTCAGSFSARTIALIVHLTDARLDDRTGLDWLRRSVRLAEQVKSMSGADYCSLDLARIDEFLMRLDEGERQDSLISGLPEEDNDMRSALVRFLLGKTGDGEFTAELRKVSEPSAACLYSFYGVWKASIDGDKTSARLYRSIMNDVENKDDCGQSMFFADRVLSRRGIS